uniref:Nucleic acid binding protein n=1 Tax=Solanum tuberosum TaxID=4113 RepID=M0ZL65_SOLTU
MMDAYWRYSSGGQQAAVLPALTPLVAKRPRNKYVAPSGPGYYERGMMRDKDSMEASYECYLRNGVLHFYLLLRPEATLPPDASSTLFVEGLPADCTRKEFFQIYSALLEVTKKLGWYQKARLYMYVPLTRELLHAEPPLLESNCRTHVAGVHP